MSDDIWKRAEIESPCIKVCVIHPEARICAGCLRSIEEIGGWSRMTPEDRRRIMDRICRARQGASGTRASAASTTSGPARSRAAFSERWRRQARAPGRPANSPSMWRVIAWSRCPAESCRSR
jgi:uncharacterized protein